MTTPTLNLAEPRLRESGWRAVRRGLTYGGLLLTLALAVFTIVIPKFTGSVPLTVLSNSMAPSMPVGSLAVVKPTLPLDMTPARLDVLTPAEVREINDLSRIRSGSIIAFQPNPGDPTLVMHRVQSIRSTMGTTGEPARHVFITRGDNLDADDRPVEEHMVRGEVWYHLPLLGFVNDKLNSGPAHTPLILGIAAVGYGLAAVYIVRAVRAKRDDARTEDGG
ncbi:hypothetical protein [Xylanimonas sp. McL0601]|uniref:hypothetical protein n=1 Tax=Xylanimonas sp. McL0601 TaxID=3414739 RepID=UPI003CF25A26